MNWNRLKRFKCPKCNNYIEDNKSSNTFVYRCVKCDFRIAKGRFNEIVNDMYIPKSRNFEENKTQEYLNNMK